MHDHEDVGALRAALVKLLCRTFDAGELRRFVSRLPASGSVARELPDARVGLTELAHAFVDAGLRHGFIDDAFVTRLAEERPRWRDDIESLRGLVADARAYAETPTHSTFELRIRFGRILLLISLGCTTLLSIDLWTDPPQRMSSAMTTPATIKMEAAPLLPSPHDPTIKQSPDIAVAPYPPDTADPAVIAARAELAAKEGRWTLPTRDNLAEHLALLDALQPDHEAIARLRKQAADSLLARGKQQLAARHANEAAETYRQLFAVWPTNKDAIPLLTEALVTEGRLLRYLAAWDDLLPIGDELVALRPNSFDGHMLRGHALFGLGRTADAVAAYRTATAIRPANRLAKAALAAARQQLLK